MANMNSIKQSFDNLSKTKRNVLGWSIFFALILLIEVFGFNYNFWTTADLKPELIASDIEFSLSEMSHSINLPNEQEISTLTIQSDVGAAYEIEFIDEGTGKINEPFTIEIFPDLDQTFKVDTFGKVHQIDIEATKLIETLDRITQIRETFSFKIDSISINNPIPFRFSLLRICVFLLLGLIIWGISYKRKVFQMPFITPMGNNEDASILKRISTGGKITTAITSFVMCVAIISVCGFHTFWTGYYSENASGVTYNYARTYENQYAELAKAFTHGQLNLLTEPSKNLQELDNPYTKASRSDGISKDEYRDSWDTAYYDGKYYVYFGVLPALMFHLPYYLITGDNFPTVVGCLISLAITIVGICILIGLISRRFFPKASIGIVCLCQIIACLSSMVVWTSAYPILYLLPQICALMFLIWGFAIYLLLDRKPWLVILGSLFLAFIFACRPQVGIFALLAIPLGVLALKKQRSKKGIYLLVALIPFIVVFIALGIYNAMRFGSPLDFGATYNLTNTDMRLRPFSIEIVISSIFYYLIQLPALIPTLPFLEATDLSYPYYGYLTSEDMLGGILFIAPIIWVSIALIHKKHWNASLFVTLIFVIAIAIFDGVGAGILPRYQMDFTLPLVIFGCAGFLQLAQDESFNRKALTVIGKCCLIAAIITTVGIAFYNGINESDAIQEVSQNIAAITPYLW